MINAVRKRVVAIASAHSNYRETKITTLRTTFFNIKPPRSLTVNLNETVTVDQPRLNPAIERMEYKEAFDFSNTP